MTYFPIIDSITACWMDCQKGFTNGKKTVSAMNEYQKNYFLKKGSFDSSFEVINPNSEDYETLHRFTNINIYRYSTRATEEVAFSYGISRLDDYKSYVGGVFLGKMAETGETTVREILCEANFSGRRRPVDPTYENGVLACGPGTHKVSP